MDVDGVADREVRPRFRGSPWRWPAMASVLYGSLAVAAWLEWAHRMSSGGTPWGKGSGEALAFLGLLFLTALGLLPLAASWLLMIPGRAGGVRRARITGSVVCGAVAVAIGGFAYFFIATSGY